LGTIENIVLTNIGEQKKGIIVVSFTILPFMRRDFLSTFRVNGLL
jgi:hypothetical protein